MTVYEDSQGYWKVKWRVGGKQHCRSFGKGPQGRTRARAFRPDRSFLDLAKDYALALRLSRIAGVTRLS